MRVRVGVPLLALGLACAGCASEPEGPPFMMTGNVQELMANMFDPAADLVWDAVGTVITIDGADHWEPTTEEEWLAVRLGAMTLTEGANLLMMEGRARDQDTWMRMSQDMVEAGRQALAAAEAEDAQAVFDVGEEVYSACNNCHNLYWVGDADRGRVLPEGPNR